MARRDQGAIIGEELASFLAGGNSLLVATRSPALEPHVTRACGLRVVAHDRVEVLLPRATSARALANLRENGDLAVCVCRPTDFRTFQLKGRCLEIGDGTPEDVLLCEGQMRGFADGVAPYGNTRAQVRNLWLFECWRLAVRVTNVYVQTPGPGAGRAHGAEDAG